MPFDGLPAGKSIKYQMVRPGTIDNISQQPMGFYLVWANEPNKAIPIPAIYPDPDRSFLQSLSSLPNSWMNTENVYTKNTVVKYLPAEQLNKIFPSPSNYKTLNGEFIIDGKTAIYSEASFLKEAAYLSLELGKVLSAKPGIVTLVPSGNSIVLQKNMQVLQMVIY